MSAVPFPYRQHSLLESVARVSDAQYAFCEHCGCWLGSPYWPLTKSVAMHKRGTGHDVTLHRIAS